MKLKNICKYLFLFLLGLVCLNATFAQEQTRTPPKETTQKEFVFEEPQPEFGPVVSAYLSYLDAEQDVTDDRASRHEISRAYYIRNTSRISALRKAVLKIVSESNNDYVPELEAVVADELHTIFEQKPDIKKLKVGDILNNTFRYLGEVRVRFVFYIFERLDIYEQADLIKQQQKQSAEKKSAATSTTKEGEQTKKPESP